MIILLLEEEENVWTVIKDILLEGTEEREENLINGLIIACQKRPISRKQIEELAEDIEKAISNKMITEVNSKIIGEMVMDRLKNLDEISYVRFASVYRQFKDINTFLEEIKNLVSNE